MISKNYSGKVNSAQEDKDYYLSDLEKYIAIEKKASKDFDKYIRKAIEASKAIHHFGDGECGYLIERFLEFLEVGSDCYSRKKERERAAYRAKIQPHVRKKVLERDKYRCLRCGTHVDLTLDHIIPTSIGGSNDFENLQTLCNRCNSSKGVKAITYLQVMEDK